MLVIVGGIMSLTMAASYIYPTVATVYIFSFVSGVGGAFLWVGQGAEVLANSNSSNIDYHSALFWFLYQISQFAGNLYVFFAWQGTDYINSKMRIHLYSILVGVGAFGLVCFAFIKLVPNEDSQEEENTEEAEKKSGTEKFVESLQSVKQAIKYCASAHFIQLMVSKKSLRTFHRISLIVSIYKLSPTPIVANCCQQHRFGYIKCNSSFNLDHHNVHWV